MASRRYWVCMCGSWTWADNSQCHGCGRGPSGQPQSLCRWRSTRRQRRRQLVGLVQRVGRGKNLQLRYLWVMVPRGRKQRRNAPAQAARIVKAANTGATTNEPGLADTEMANGENGLEERISAAQCAVAKSEAIPGAFPDLVHDFGERLACAHAARDALFQERRAAKPWVWRLKHAEKAALRAEEAKTKP